MPYFIELAILNLKKVIEEHNFVCSGGCQGEFERLFVLDPQTEKSIEKTIRLLNKHQKKIGVRWIKMSDDYLKAIEAISNVVANHEYGKKENIEYFILPEFLIEKLKMVSSMLEINYDLKNK